MTLYAVMHWMLDEDKEETHLVAIFSSGQMAREYINDQNPHPANNEWWVAIRELDKEY